MALDFTAPGLYRADPHFRRILMRDNRIGVVCVQSFDYRDYDPSRFADVAVFDSEAEAEASPIAVAPLVSVIESGDDPEAAAQAYRVLRAISYTWPVNGDLLV